MDAEQKANKIRRLNKQIAQCTRCRLCRSRTNTVPGDGSVDADIMFIGEAPGRSEDLKGLPFVGRAGAILDELLGSVNLSRDEIYICNILKCRPPGNRDPSDKEIEACVGSLEIQIKTIDPKIIATLGRFSTAYILQRFHIESAKISELHGKIVDAQTPFGLKRIVPLFHPAVATYNPAKLDVLLKDFQVLKK